jgi:hypothetical protein
MAALAAYDVAVTSVSFVGLAWLPTRLAGSVGGDSTASWVAVIGSVLAGLAASAVLRWRPGRWSSMWSASLARPEDPLGRRGRLLLDVERHAARAVSRWIMKRSDDCRRQAGVTPDQLLPAAWPAVRLLLRETDDREGMGLALVLSQAQAVVDDGSPAQERLLTLLQLVHDRTGPAGVRRVLDQAVRAPVRHGRTGAPVWGLGPTALPRQGVPTVSLPVDHRA